MKKLIEEFNQYLQQVLESVQPSTVREAMAYSLLAGGKRIRPLLLFELLEASGMDPVYGFPAAAAIEMIHTYSLIHDDLPCMDNDEFRRGKPTCHVAYGEAMALLAGDALLTKAFSILATAPYPDGQKVACIQILSDCAGPDGMVLGQVLDLGISEPDLEELKRIETLKTARMIQASFLMGCILSGRDREKEAWLEVGKLLGIQFQIVDDLLELTSDEETMQKSLSDARNNKKTFPVLMGLEASRREVDSISRQMDEILDSLKIPEGNLRKTIRDMRSRKY